ncbi:MAG: glycosyltransferase family 2 protein [Pseudomonadota bacterium]
MKKISIIIPAKNEEQGLSKLLPELISLVNSVEIVVVSDGSTDNTINICKENRVTVVIHPYSKGNGAAIKSGARAAKGDTFIFMDADGQHRPTDVKRLVEEYQSGEYDMIVGARDNKSQASKARQFGNGLYNRIASYMTGHKIEDLTSGMRIVDATKFKQFLYLLPNGFSYPTTTTMAFFRAGYTVKYMPIKAPKRLGKSHINIFKDGMKFFLIIFKIGTLYSPLKLFFPASMVFFFLGLVYYIYTFMTDGRFTNMGALLFSVSVLVFLMGLISEQITALMYQNNQLSSRSKD